MNKMYPVRKGLQLDIVGKVLTNSKLLRPETSYVLGKMNFAVSGMMDPAFYPISCHFVMFFFFFIKPPFPEENKHATYLKKNNNNYVASNKNFARENNEENNLILLVFVFCTQEYV